MLFAIAETARQRMLQGHAHQRHQAPARHADSIAFQFAYIKRHNREAPVDGFLMVASDRSSSWAANIPLPARLLGLRTCPRRARRRKLCRVGRRAAERTVGAGGSATRASQR